MKAEIQLSVNTKHISTYVPSYESEGAAGVDIRADIANAKTLAPLERILVETGLYIALPNGIEAQIRPRSGLAIKKGLSLVNTPGTIDPDYRGEIKVPLINLSSDSVTIEPGDRIAQMVFASFIQGTFSICTKEDLPATTRGAGGFGSTGAN